MSHASKSTGRSSKSSKRFPGDVSTSRPVGLWNMLSTLPSSPSVTRRCAFSIVSPPSTTSSPGSPRVATAKGSATQLAASRDREGLSHPGLPVDHIAAREARRVHRHAPGTDQLVDPPLELREVTARVVVHERDRRAGKDVVELLQEQQLPQAVELGVRILASTHRGKKLGVAQADLALAVAPLDEGLRRVDAAVVLEVELADDDGPLAGLGLERVEELAGRCDPRPRQSLQVARARQALEHFARRPASAITVAEDEQARVRMVEVLVLAGRLQQLVDVRHRAVVVGR